MKKKFLELKKKQLKYNSTLLINLNRAFCFFKIFLYKLSLLFVFLPFSWVFMPKYQQRKYARLEINSSALNT